MIKSQRKRHLQVWTWLAVLIPAGIISGYLVIPGEVTDKLLQVENLAALPVVISKFEGKDYTVYLRSSAEKTIYQLQWVNTEASTFPSSLIYKASSESRSIPLVAMGTSKGGDLKPTELIGRIEAKGNYYFSLKTDSTGTYNFILYDIIHQQSIDTIKF